MTSPVAGAMPPSVSTILPKAGATSAQTNTSASSNGGQSFSSVFAKVVSADNAKADAEVKSESEGTNVPASVLKSRPGTKTRSAKANQTNGLGAIAENVPLNTVKPETDSNVANQVSALTARTGQQESQYETTVLGATVGGPISKQVAKELPGEEDKPGAPTDRPTSILDKTEAGQEASSQGLESEAPLAAQHLSLIANVEKSGGEGLNSPNENKAPIPVAVMTISEPKASPLEKTPQPGEVSNTTAGSQISAVTNAESTRSTHTIATPSARPIAAQIADQVSPHMDQLRQVGRAELQIDLHPPELGRVQLHLSMENGKVNVHMTVQDENAKRMIDQQMAPLRVRFSEMGVSVGQFDVRRDGGSPNPEKQPASEPSAQTLQTAKNEAARLQKTYLSKGNSLGLVDVIA